MSDSGDVAVDVDVDGDVAGGDGSCRCRCRCSELSCGWSNRLRLQDQDSIKTS